MTPYPAISPDVKTARQTMKNDHAQIQAILQAIPDMLFQIRADGIFTFGHAMDTTQLLYPPEFFVGKKCEEILPPDLAELTYEKIEKTLASRQIQTYEYVLPTGEGKKYYETRMVYVRDNHVLAIVRDITERKALKKKLQEKKDRLNLALATAKIGYWRWEINTNEVKWFGDHGALFGIENSEFGGTIDHVQKMVHPDDREMGMGNLQKTLDTGKPFNNTYRVQHPDKSVHWLNSFGYLTRNDQGTPDYIFGITRDITEFKHAEEKLSAYSRQLEETNITLNRLIENQVDQKKRMAENILQNFEQLVFPFFEKLRVCHDHHHTNTLLKIMEKNIRKSLAGLERISPLVAKKLTIIEISIADLIKLGHSTKEIADILNMSPRTVFFYRNKIREKLDIQHTKTNLRSHLLKLM